MRNWIENEVFRSELPNTLIDQASYLLVIAFLNTVLLRSETLDLAYPNISYRLLKNHICTRLFLQQSTCWCNHIYKYIYFFAFRFRNPNYKHPYKTTPSAPCFSLCSIPHSNISSTNWMCSRYLLLLSPWLLTFVNNFFTTQNDSTLFPFLFCCVGGRHAENFYQLCELGYRNEGA